MSEATLKNNRAKYLDVIKNPRFFVLWANQIIQQLSFGILNFSLVILVLNKTGSNLAVSLVLITLTLPVLVFGPLGGVIADTFDRKKIIQTTDALLALGIFFLLLTKDSFFFILINTFLISTFSQFFIPAEGASLPMVVLKRELLLANSLFAFTLYGTQVAGISLAGPLISFFGFGRVFFALSLALFIAFIVVGFLPSLQLIKGAKSPFVLEEWKKIFDFFKNSINAAIERIILGLKFIKNHRPIWLGLVLLALTEASLAIMAVLAPSFVKESLGVAPENIGFLLVPPAGLGFLLSASLVGRFGHFFEREFVASLGLLGEGSIIFIVSILPKILSIFNLEDFVLPIFSVCGFLIGCFAVWVVVPSRTILQERTPGNFLGRVFSTLSILTILGSSVPIIIAGTAADIIGASRVLSVLGIILASSAFFALRPKWFEKFATHQA